MSDPLPADIQQWKQECATARDLYRRTKAYRELLERITSGTAAVLARASGDLHEAEIPALSGARTVRELRAFHAERLAELVSLDQVFDEIAAALERLDKWGDRLAQKYGIDP